MRKVLCFVGELNVDFQTQLTKKLSDIMTKNDCEIHFIANFDTNVANALYGEIERKIFTIPDLNVYDGIITCPDTFAIPGMETEIANYLAENAKCPVVSLRVPDERFYSITLGDYDAVCEITRHFVVEHKKERVCFMTGRMELEDAHRRLAAYKNTMEELGIEVTEGMVFYGDYWREKGDEAVDWFIKKNDKLPQAIICSNDYMAISVCNAIAKRGLKIPEDICVSGLDDIDEAQYHIPPITSIRASVSKISQAAFDVFKDVWNNIPHEKNVVLPLDIQYRNSCGCKKDIDFHSFQKLYDQKELYLSALNFSPYLGLDFESAESFDELVTCVHMRLTNKSYGHPDDFGTLYFCLCDESGKNTSEFEKTVTCTENMYLRAIVSSKGINSYNVRFDKGEIVPMEYRKHSYPMYVFSLHCKEFFYGYMAVQNKDISKIKNLIKPLHFALGNALEKIRIFSENKMVQALREQSYVDELTGIPNRRSMERFIRKLYERLQHTEQQFCIMSLDLDGLKYINDTFGHLEGDIAIKTAAKILDAAKPEYSMAARTGGDEFIVLFASDDTEDAENYIKEITARVEKTNKEWDKPYKLSVSAGYEYCNRNDEMLLCMHKADIKMYENKKAKKKNRTN